MKIIDAEFPRGIAVMLGQHAPDGDAEYVAGRLSRALPGSEIFIVPDPTEIQAADTVEVLITWVRPWIAQIARTCPALKWIHILSSGVERLWDLDFDKEKYLISNSAGVHAVPIAEYVMASMLYFLKDLHIFREHRHSRTWQPHPVKEARGQTVAVIGLGSIGREVARRCRRMGMRVIGLARRARHDDLMGHVYGEENLADVLSVADFVVLALPLTPNTHGLLNRRLLRSVKPGAYLINISRGAVVDEPALIELLQKGTLGGAALDVFAEEPLPPESPLWDLENVIITPHVSGTTPLYMERAMDIFLENLHAVKAAGELVTGVNIKAKY